MMNTIEKSLFIEIALIVGTVNKVYLYFIKH